MRGRWILMMDGFFTATIVAAFIFALELFSSSVVLAGEARRLDSDWEAVVKTAKAEGQLAIYANTSFEAIFPEFRKKYPEIKITYVTGVGAPDVVPRVLSEQRGGKFLGDLALLGGSGLYALYQAKALDPLKPALLLPEVVDESKWWEGRHDYLDKERNFIFSFNGVSRVDVVYNKELVDPKELKSYWDLLNPKWKGKIVAFSHIQSPHRYFYYHPDLGQKFLTRLYGEMKAVQSDSMRQIADWLAVGKFSIAVPANGSHRDVKSAQTQELPIGTFKPDQFKEGANLNTAIGIVALLKQAPHPNAAKLALNWLLSREGQLAFQVHEKRLADSLRIDIPKNDIAPEVRRVAGVKYFSSEDPEFIDPKPIRDLISKATGASK
jgi:ABC-type Fe3+ transport system substrate-binding protein